MPVSEVDRDRLRQIKTFPSLVKYLRDELDWPVAQGDFVDLDDLTFEYSPEELGIDAKTAAKIDEIKQLRPLASGQPWGIFFLKFEPKRLPIVVLRKILARLIVKKRDSANASDRKVWRLHDLLFISNYGESDERQITFAHFIDNNEHGDLPSLKVLGWDEKDAELHLDRVAAELREKLSWKEGEAVDDWRRRWASAFRLRPRETIETSKQLAIRLAELARDTRTRANRAMKVETERGPLKTLMAGFKQALIHDMDEDRFADMYAQTIAYGLLSATIRRTVPGEGHAVVADNLVDIVNSANPFLRELMTQFLNVGGRKWSDERGKLVGIDFDELGINDVVDTLRQTNMEAVLEDFGNRNPQEDPVIHFYELFLKEYDAKMRMQRGVFYTPRPVVSYIVRSVHELLQSEFGLPDGLADTTTWGEMRNRQPDLKLPEIEVVDPKTHKVSMRAIDPKEPFVQILDPATGTATFLVEVIDVIHKHLATKWAKEGHGELWIDRKWNDYVPRHLLPRVHGYELMMAPYAIAHMKIGLKLFETGYKFGSGERARIYLTNALEPPQDFSDTFEQMAPALAHEAKAVNDVKRHRRFTVVIGNPPYSHLSANLSERAMAIVDVYKYIDGQRISERGALSLQKNLQDDYVKFYRIAEREIEKVDIGLIGLITNNSYLDSRSFRGMRFQLSALFSDGWLLDLHGSGKKDELVGNGNDRDVNVFDIMQGVGIALWVRASRRASPATVRRSDLLGPREAKYGFLANHSVSTGVWESIHVAPPFYPFVKQDINLLTEYQTFSSVKEIFPLYSSGVKTHRDDFAYAFTRREMVKKLRDFCDATMPDAELRNRYGLKDTNVWRLTAQRASADLPTLRRDVRDSLYRPFDIRSTCFSDEIIELTRRAVMAQMLESNNIALLCSQQQAEEGFRHVFCTRMISDWGAVSNRTRESTSAFPLWLRHPIGRRLGQPNLDFQRGPCPNVDTTWLRTFGTPEEVLHVIYALLHAPSFRTRYAPFLRSDFPRVPFPADPRLSEQLKSLGGELVRLHLLESARLESTAPVYSGAAQPEVEKLSYADDTVWLDKKQTRGFVGVPAPVWNFHIGGYRVCEKWLKDRKGRTLCKDDIAHYQKIVVALSETIRLMKEIDEVIDKHGGWPGAFVTSPEHKGGKRGA